MQLAKLIVCVLALVTRICFARWITETSEADRTIVKATIDILTSCYKDRIGTVGLAGPSIGNIIERISIGDTIIPATSIGETSKIVSHDPVDGASRHKLQVFVVTVTNSSDLVRTLVQVKNSKWWNHMASFILIGWTDVLNECSNAHEILWEAWKMNLLNSKFLCHQRTRGWLIYTFNPYASKAPVPWQQENTYKGINDHAWTLFVREYRENELRCDAMDFDKTSDLGGYKIRAFAASTVNSGSADPRLDWRSYVHQIEAEIFCTSLNATWEFQIQSKSEGPPRDEKGIPRGWAAEVLNGSSDIGFSMMIYHPWSKYETTYPNFEFNLVVMNQYPGHKSQLDKLISVLDKSSRIGVFVVLLITLLFFACYLRVSPIPAILNIVLIICNAALLKVPKKLAPRIYLSTLLILVVTIQGIYQGKLASLLTKQERLPTVNSIDDLAQSDHTIYGLNYWDPFLNQSTFVGRYVRITEYNCTNNVLADPKAACVDVSFRLINEAVKFKMHLSHKSLGTAYGANLVRPDWPLIDRINFINGRAKAANIIQYRFNRKFQSDKHKLESYENQGRDPGFKPLTLGQLSFAFVILAIGLVCATISFIIEVLIYDQKSYSKTNSIDDTDHNVLSA